MRGWVRRSSWRSGIRVPADIADFTFWISAQHDGSLDMTDLEWLATVDLSFRTSRIMRARFRMRGQGVRASVRHGLAIGTDVLGAIGGGPIGAVISGLFPRLLQFVGSGANYGEAMKDEFAIGAATGAAKFGLAGRDHTVGKNVHSAFIVGEHARPFFVFGAVGKHFFGNVAFTVFPVLDEHALVKGEMDVAGGGAGTVRAGEGPATDPVVELAGVGIVGAWGGGGEGRDSGQ